MKFIQRFSLFSIVLANLIILAFTFLSIKNFVENYLQKLDSFIGIIILISLVFFLLLIASFFIISFFKVKKSIANTPNWPFWLKSVNILFGIFMIFFSLIHLLYSVRCFLTNCDSGGHISGLEFLALLTIIVIINTIILLLSISANYLKNSKPTLAKFIISILLIGFIILTISYFLPLFLYDTYISGYGDFLFGLISFSVPAFIFILIDALFLWALIDIFKHGRR